MDLGSATSKILINGQPTKAIRHERGLRQGDPLSPMLFILAIDPLQCIIEVAANKGILNPVLPRAASLRCSLYTDDAAIFAAPNSLEINHLHRILCFFRMFGPQNQYIQNGNLPNSVGQHLGHTTTPKLPRKNLQLPWQVPWSSTACKKTKENRCATSFGQDRGKITGMER